MSDQAAQPLARSPLEHWAGELAAGSSSAGPQGVVLAELRLPTLINLRGAPSDSRFCQAASDALGVNLPLEPNRFSRLEPRRCLWLGPDEWLVVGEPGSGAALTGRLVEALAGQHAAIVEVSAAYAVLELAGARAREVLAKACSIDLHPRAFRAGQCVQSNFARTQAIVALEDDAPVFRLYVRRSVAEYLAQWLLDAMREYRGSGRA